jgi:hypothetical protein
MKTNHHPLAAARFPHPIATALIFAAVGLSPLAEASKLRFLPVNQELAERKLGIQDAKGMTELKDLSPVKRSMAYSVPDGETPVELVALDRERPGGKPSGIELTVPDGMESPLVLVFPDAEHPAGFRAVVVDDSEAGFPWGSLRFVNTSEKALKLRYDRESREVPSSHAVVDVRPEGDARNLGVQLTPQDEPDETLYSSVWEHDPNVRKLIFILGGEDEEKTEITLAIIPQDKRAKD